MQDHHPGLEQERARRAAAERSLHESEQRLRRIFDHSNDAILVIDPAADRILEANARAADMLGYDADELIARVTISAVHPQEMTRLRAFAGHVMARGSGWTNELSCTCKDGRRLPSEISASVVSFDGRDCIIAVVRDVTKRKAAEEALRRSEERFRAFVENAGDGFFAVDADGCIRDVNSRACDILGYRRDELVGRNVLDIDAGLTPEAFGALLGELQLDRSQLLESRHRRKDGSVFPSEVSICAYGDPRRPNYIALLRDVSRRKEAEAAIARLAEMGEFAAMIIHQVRNPLATIDLCLEHFARPDLDARTRKRLDLARGESVRLAQLLDEVLDYAGRMTLALAPCAIDELIRGLVPALTALPALAGRDLRVRTGLPGVRVQADADKLGQAVTNMVANAAEAVATGEAVELRTGGTAAAPRIEVQNGGEPIPPDVLARIGQPLFSTKGRGNGLGVAYTRRVAAAHHWDFTLTSTAAEGTVARLRL
ncbi:PAS domain S-box protein [uncultured Thiohalocapsa sp.]|uniref:PAS domain S-box protein n=1 Tax=uncultured Thiohalocapsa sp. TaxID=768990 RepID=UPI0025EC39F7|nr:PAS domain S-box protein [uncultured Thiohalocapsa sp.]